jgi:hypothetical protein
MEQETAMNREQHLEFVKGARQRAEVRAAKVRADPRAKEVAKRSRRLLQEGGERKNRKQKSLHTG